LRNPVVSSRSLNRLREVVLFGVDELIAGLGNGASPLLVLAIALLLGLRHASDPDHLVAVSSLVAVERERPVRRASGIAFAWGLGHGTTVVALGLPVILFSRSIPSGIQAAAEVVVGLVIVLLALRVLRLWRANGVHVHEHAHSGMTHRHLHRHDHAHAGDHLRRRTPARHGHDHVTVGLRSPLQSYGLGVVHGVGGSAAVTVLLLASIPSSPEAIAALVLFAVGTGISMAVLSVGFAFALARGGARHRLDVALPLLAATSLLFGAWYTAVAVGALV